MVGKKKKKIKLSDWNCAEKKEKKKSDLICLSDKWTNLIPYAEIS